MTINWIIEELKKSGVGSKQKVLFALENASKNELCELERSITSFWIDKHLNDKNKK